MEARTLEQYFLHEYARLQQENEELRTKLEEAQDVLDSVENGSRAYRIDEPINVVRLEVADSGELERSKSPVFGMKAYEIRDAVSTREGLENLASLKCEKYGLMTSLVALRRRVYPMSIFALNRTFAIDVNEAPLGCDPLMVSTAVRMPSEGFEDGCTYPAECADNLYEKGLEILKERLLAYADKLEAEGGER